MMYLAIIHLPSLIVVKRKEDGGFKPMLTTRIVPYSRNQLAQISQDIRSDILEQRAAGEPASVVDLHYAPATDSHDAPWLFARAVVSVTDENHLAVLLVEGDGAGHEFLLGQRGVSVAQLRIVRSVAATSFEGLGASVAKMTAQSLTAIARSAAALAASDIRRRQELDEQFFQQRSEIEAERATMAHERERKRTYFLQI